MARWAWVAAFLALVFASPSARALNISFTGTFTHDTDLQYFTFTLDAPAMGVALRTWSYAGGTNAAGQAIAAGGFEPYLNLYFSDGTQMNPGTPGPCSAPPTGNAVADLLPDGATGACSDVYYPTTLAFPGGTWDAGTYTVVLSSAANPGIGNLGDGFFAEAILGVPAPGNFTCQEGPLGYQGSPPTYPTDAPFCEPFTGTPRTGAWALDFYNVDSATGPAAAAVAEPPALGLLVLGGLALAARARRRRG